MALTDLGSTGCTNVDILTPSIGYVGQALNQPASQKGNGRLEPGFNQKIFIGFGGI